MKMLFRNYGLHEISTKTTSFVKFMSQPGELQAFNNVFYKKLTATYKNELHQLGMASLQIVDSFDFEDQELMSTIGQKKYNNDDEVYEEMVRVFRANPINKQPVPKGYHEWVTPLLARL